MTVARVTDMLGLLTRAPRTIPELHTLTGISEPRLRAWLQALTDEGLVVDGGRREVWSETANRAYHHYIYEWNAK
jgi:DNA-binding IclR family transcriptional regulator